MTNFFLNDCVTGIKYVVNRSLHKSLSTGQKHLSIRSSEFSSKQIPLRFIHDPHVSSMDALITFTKEKKRISKKKNHLTNHNEFYSMPYIDLYKHIEMHFHQYVYN